MTKRRTLYRKHFTGRSTGSPRDAGHPIPCSVDYDATNADELQKMATDHGKEPDQRYELVVEEVKPLGDNEVERLVREGLESKKKAKEEAERRKDEAELQRLQKKLGNK
jgi:hypothetical protein